MYLLNKEIENENNISHSLNKLFHIDFKKFVNIGKCKEYWYYKTQTLLNEKSDIQNTIWNIYESQVIKNWFLIGVNFEKLKDKYISQDVAYTYEYILYEKEELDCKISIKLFKNHFNLMILGDDMKKLKSYMNQYKI
jgi:hypothetical protein